MIRQFKMEFLQYILLDFFGRSQENLAGEYVTDITMMLYAVQVKGRGIVAVVFFNMRPFMHRF